MIKKCSSVLLFLLLAVSAFAEDIVLKDVPIKQALTYVSGITGKTYLYTGEDIKVTWEREGIPIGNVSREFDSILQKYNMELDYSGGTVFISKHGSTFNSSSVVVHRLSWIDAEALSKSLGDVWKESISITSFGDVLVLSGNRSSIEQLLLKIRKYDTPVATEIAQFRLEHAPAEKVVEVLNKDVDLKGMVNADSWSNSIIVRGHNFYQLIVESYCQKLDVPQQAQNYEIIDTVNLDAEVVVEALSEITDTAKVKLLSESKILVSGIPSDVQRVSEMVKQIDGQRVQVHITAVIALLNDQQYSELGLKLGYDNPGVSITTGILSAVYDPTFLISLLSSTTGVDVSATEGHSLSSVISEPSLTVKSGKTAELLVGKEVPIKTSESVSEEGSVTSTTIERKNVGVKLAVTPVVRGNFIDIKLYQEISSLSNGNSDVDITTNTESMSTELMLSNGQTMIIGGVKVVERNDMNEGVPVLRHVPVIGGILGYNSEDGERQNVVVSITANIIKEV